MNHGSWKALLIYLVLGYIFSMGAGIILCNIWSCGQAQVSGEILKVIWIPTVMIWFLIRGKKKKEK